MMPTTRVPRMIAAPITHSRVDCPRFELFTFSLQSLNRFAVKCAASSKRPLHDSPEKWNHDQDHELRQVDTAKNGQQFGSYRSCLRRASVALIHAHHQFLVAKRRVQVTADPLALCNGAYEHGDVVHACPYPDFLEGLLDGQPQAIAPQGSLNFTPQQGVSLTIDRKNVERPFEWHAGHGESPEEADQLGQLPLQGILPSTSATGQVSTGGHITGPGEERDEHKGARKGNSQQSGEQRPSRAAHQPKCAEFDAVNLIRLEACLNQVMRIDAGWAKTEPASPKQGDRTDPALIPTLVSPLLQPPLDGRKRCRSNQPAGGRLAWSQPAKNRLQSSKARQRSAQSREHHASNRAIRKLKAMPVNSSTAATGRRTKRPSIVSSSTLNSCGFTSRR